MSCSQIAFIDVHQLKFIATCWQSVFIDEQLLANLHLSVWEWLQSVRVQIAIVLRQVASHQAICAIALQSKGCWYCNMHWWAQLVVFSLYLFMAGLPRTFIISQLVMSFWLNSESNHHITTKKVHAVANLIIFSCKLTADCIGLIVALSPSQRTKAALKKKATDCECLHTYHCFPLCDCSISSEPCWC